MRLSRFVIPLMAAAFAAAPAFAAEPIEIVQGLYDNHPYETDPPGGMELWTGDMQVLWQKLAEDEAKRIAGELDFMGEGLTFDFVIGGQEDDHTGVKIKTVAQIEDEADVLASVGKGADAPYVIHYGFLRDDTAGWQISEVWMDGEGGWRLSDLIKETR